MLLKTLGSLGPPADKDHAIEFHDRAGAPAAADVKAGIKIKLARERNEYPY